MKPVYLDYQATTPTDPCVVEAMRPYWTQDFGNPHSEGHPFGWRARQAVERARSQVADFIGADDDEIIFVSGATESCNLALRGVAATASSVGRWQIITVATEHAAVLQTALWLGGHGFDTEVLPVEPDGILDLRQLEAAVGERTLLVSCMLANNEIGVIQPVSKVAALSHGTDAIVHTDATQAAGRVRINVDELGVDLLSLSAHKVYGPNGVGALYIRNRAGLQMEPIYTGGSQERSLRPGTVAVPLVVGMGEACAIAGKQLTEEARRMTLQGQRLLCELQSDFPNLRVFGSMEQRVPGNLNVGLPDVLGERLVEAVSNEVAISTGAACSTGSPEPSHVLLALGIDGESAATAVRISIGRFTTDEEISVASRSLRRALLMLTGGD